METLVIYDISDDSIRGEVAQICKRFGLSRIQKSAFMGRTTSFERKEMEALFRRVLGDENGNIQIFVICRADLALRRVIGKDYREYARDEDLIF